MKYYPTDFMPQGLKSGYCSLTVLLGILNYFFGTYFSSKDNWDVFALAMSGRANAQLLELDTIALFLDRLYLDVTVCTAMTKIDYQTTLISDDLDTILDIYKKYINPQWHQYIHGNKMIYSDSGDGTEIVDMLVRKRIKDSTMKFQYHIDRFKLIDLVKQNQNLQDGGILFLLGLNRHILYDELPGSVDDSGGHIVLSTGVNENNQFIIYEPIRPRPNPHFINIDKVLDAIGDIDGYNMIIIKDNSKHI